MRGRLTGAALAAVTIALAASGCGDSGDDDGAGAATTTTVVEATTTAAATVTTTAPDTTVTTPPPATAATTTTAPATPAPSAARAAYLRRADALCRTSNAVAKRLNTRANAAIRTAKDDAERLTRLAPILTEGLARQRRDLAAFVAITPPAADRAVIGRYQDIQRRQVENVAALERAARAGDIAAYTRASTRTQVLRDESRALARSFGFTECGSGRSDAD